MRVRMAFKDEINYEKISQINKKERKTSKLTNLDPEFYLALISHLKELQEEYNKKYIESPTSMEALLLNNEICKLESIVKEIYTRRERKVLLAALDLGVNSDLRNMLEHEKRLYQSLVDTLNGFRSKILNQKPNHVCEELESKIYETKDKVMSVEPGDGEPERSTEDFEIAPDKTEIIGTELEVVPEQEHKHKSEYNQEQTDQSNSKPEYVESVKNDEVSAMDNDTVLVYVLEDLKPFVGIDMLTYQLKKEDLVTLPRKNAEILKKNNKINLVEIAI